MTVNQRNWVELLDSVQFCYNLYGSSTKEKGLFQLVLGMKVNPLLEFTESSAKGKCPATHDKRELLNEVLDYLRKIEK